MNYPSPHGLTHLPPPTACLHHVFHRKDWLPLRSSCLWQIETGMIRTLTWNDEGAVATLGLWGAGEVVGQPLSLVQPYQMECLSAVKVSELPLRQVLQPELQDLILSSGQRHEELLNILHCRQAPLRLLQLLEWLSQRFGRPVKQGRLIDLRLTHQELSETIGTTRVTVTRLLGQFEQEGRICRLGHHFVLPIGLAST